MCIQPLASHIAREQQDCTTHKTDEADCVMIARPAVPDSTEGAVMTHRRGLLRRVGAELADL